ncbi:O-antigen ligase family protein [Undibacterium sp. TS12]|uniref:PglL family O-oligosaccharyltransferase n=1 Tax=Undibacterium sp. TS12 TaxID=2908202 RepID=UPI001F4CF476|nr:O-antigen ligase family protein [Undibacterium sp. TS12]MCH8622246.1 Wzy polymerase domain-containing protein [Undibacterium sp. TS12]
MASDKEGKLALIIFAVAIFFSYVHPYHIHPYRTFYHELIVFLGLAAALAYFVVSRPAQHPQVLVQDTITSSSEARLSFPVLLLLPLGIVLMIVAQTLAGLIQPAMMTAFPVMYLLMFGVAIVFGASLALTRDGPERAVNAFALANLLAAVTSLLFQHVQILGLNATPLVMYIAKDPHAAMRPYANVAQPNQLALLYFFALSSVWFFYRSKRMPSWFCIGLAALLLWGIVLTQSRIGWILVPLFFLYTVSKLGHYKRSGALIMVGLVILYALLTIFLPQISQAIGFSGGSVADHIGGRSERTVLWQTAWQLAKDHPLFGVGWFGYGVGQVGIAAQFASSTYAEHAHNLPLNLAAELGIPAALLIMGGLAWWFYQTCFKPQKKLVLQFATLSFFAVGVHSMVEFPLWYGFVLLPVGVLMGMVHQMRWPSTGTVVNPAAVLAGFALVCALIAAVTLDYQRVIVGFKILRNVQQGYRPMEELLQKPEYTLFPQFFEYFKLTRIKPVEGMSAEDIAYVETWSKRFGFVHILNAQAEIYVLNGQSQKAEHTMLTLQRLHPIFYPEYYDYWKAKAAQDERYKTIFLTMPPRDAP